MYLFLSQKVKRRFKLAIKSCFLCLLFGLIVLAEHNFVKHQACGVCSAHRIFCIEGNVYVWRQGRSSRKGTEGKVVGYMSLCEIMLFKVIERERQE